MRTPDDLGLAPRSVPASPYDLGTWSSVSTPKRTRNALGIVSLVVALIAVAVLIPLGVASIKNSHEIESHNRALSALRGQTRSLDQRVRESADAVEAQFGDLGNRLDEASSDQFNPAGVVAQIQSAVFTVESGRTQGSGFGFVSYGGETWIATNYHVIKASTWIGGPLVTIRHGSSEWVGKAWNWDQKADVALVKVNASLPTLDSAFSSGHPPTVGDSVLAYGSPLGLEGTATVGIISAVRRGYIQTDAQINHGNSGGPLVNAFGEVLGLTTLGYGEGSGVGFAVDIRTLCSKLMHDSC
jgi:S1-C subfamily serine protease